MFIDLKSVTHEVNDLSRAREWYGELLRRKPIFESPFAVVFQIGSASLSLVKGEGGISTDSSTTYWEVNSIAGSCTRLAEMGAEIIAPAKTVMNITRAKLMDPFGNTIGITSSQSAGQECTVERESSETAMLVTFCRALGSVDMRETIRGEDRFAHLFLSDHYRKAFAGTESREWAKRKLTSIYGYVLARSAYGDEIFCNALAKGVPQIVILGAGYDTRCSRYCDRIGDTKLFELDIESTQQRKREVLQREGMESSAVTYVSVNFSRDSLAEALVNAGYKRDEKTLFIWEGVTPYLSRESVTATLSFFQEYAASGSLLFFDYLTEQRSSSVDAEPFLFWMDREEMSGLLQSFDIEEIETVSSSEIEKRFLTNAKGECEEKTLIGFNFFYGVIK